MFQRFVGWGSFDDTKLPRLTIKSTFQRFWMSVFQKVEIIIGKYGILIRQTARCKYSRYHNTLNVRCILWQPNTFSIGIYYTWCGEWIAWTWRVHYSEPAFKPNNSQLLLVYVKWLDGARQVQSHFKYSHIVFVTNPPKHISYNSIDIGFHWK